MLDGDNWCSCVHENKWDKFYEDYKYELDQYDGFIATYPPVFARLFERTNKPIIIDIPIRYEYGMDSSPDSWNAFNTFLKKPNVHLVANSMYDKKYTEAFLGVDVKHIPSLCEYTNAKYSAAWENFIYYHSAPLSEMHKNALHKNSALTFGYKWQDLYKFSGIIHFPYNASTMSFFEQYTAGVPLFFPSMNFLLELYQQGYDVLGQMSWNKAYNKKPGSIILHLSRYDPNNYADIYSVAHWVEYADFYNKDSFPNVQFFDTFKEINDIVELISLDSLISLSGKMIEDNKKRKSEVYKRWREVLDGL